jgi:hypothetical protein
MQQIRTKRQQPLNAGRTNGKKLQLEIEEYPYSSILDRRLPLFVGCPL